MMSRPTHPSHGGVVKLFQLFLLYTKPILEQGAAVLGLSGTFSVRTKRDMEHAYAVSCVSDASREYRWHHLHYGMRSAAFLFNFRTHGFVAAHLQCHRFFSNHIEVQAGGLSLHTHPARPTTARASLLPLACLCCLPWCRDSKFSDVEKSTQQRSIAGCGVKYRYRGEG